MLERNLASWFFALIYKSSCTIFGDYREAISQNRSYDDNNDDETGSTKRECQRQIRFCLQFFTILFSQIEITIRPFSLMKLT